MTTTTTSRPVAHQNDAHKIPTTTATHQVHTSKVHVFDTDVTEIRDVWFEAVQNNPEWTDITPSRRHGEEVSRPVQHVDNSLVHCLVVEHDIAQAHDIAELQFIHMDRLPQVHFKHEIYSICLSKDVLQSTLDHHDHAGHLTKIFFMGDHSMFSEPQVNAITLLMHAKLRPGGMKAGLRHDRDVEMAEELAEHYCKSTGINRGSLATHHTGAFPQRVSRARLEVIKEASPQKHRGSLHSDTTRNDKPRRNSTTPHFVVRMGTNEHGGISNSVVVTPTGMTKGLHETFNADHDVHPDQSLTKAEKKAKKAAKKASEGKQDMKKATSNQHAVSRFVNSTEQNTATKSNTQKTMVSTPTIVIAPIHTPTAVNMHSAPLAHHTASTATHPNNSTNMQHHDVLHHNGPLKQSPMQVV